MPTPRPNLQAPDAATALLEEMLRAAILLLSVQ